MIVLAIFAEATTPTLVLRRSRRQVNCSFSPAAAGTGAARFRATVRLPTGRAATAAFAGAFAAAAGTFAAAAGAFAAAARVFAGALARVAVVFVAVFFSVFSATGVTLSRSLAHHREKASDLAPRLRHGAEVLELARGELELRVEELLTRTAQLIRDLVIRQPPHVLHPPQPPLSR